VGHVAEGARQFHPRRPAADDDEGQPRLPLDRVAEALGRLEGVEDAAAHGGGVLDRFQAGRELLPLRVAEVVVCRAGRDEQRVVRQARAVGEQHGPAGQVEADRLAQQDAGVALPFEDRPQGRGDVSRREPAGRHLVEQRLEEVEVAAVQERQLDRRAAQGLGRVQAAEAAADDDHPVRAHGRPSWRRNRRGGVILGPAGAGGDGGALRFDGTGP
jgi:hypothetical protein